MVSRYGFCLLIVIMNVMIRKFAAGPSRLLATIKEVSRHDESELTSLSPIPILSYLAPSLIAHRTNNPSQGPSMLLSFHLCPHFLTIDAHSTPRQWTFSRLMFFLV